MMFLAGMAFLAMLLLIYRHFRGSGPLTKNPVTLVEAHLEAFGLRLTHLEQAALAHIIPTEERILSAMSQAFNDAFAAFVAAKNAERDKAVSEAIAAERANQQAALDEARAAGASAESDEDVAAVNAATAALNPA